MLDVPKKSDKSHADGKILQSVSDGVGVITFNNPEKRNAMSLDMWEGLGLRFARTARRSGGARGDHGRRGR